MEAIQNRKTGYRITTYRLRLYDRHFNWLVQTEQLYIQTVTHFVSVLSAEKGLLERSDFLLLRALEECCIGTKEMKAAGILPKYPLEGFPKIPLYFRRSAINSAISFVRKQQSMSVSASMVQVVKKCPILLYKGMYQNFTGNSIQLKVFTGEVWKWVTYPYHGRSIPDAVEILSPTLVLKQREAWLHVPVSVTVQDVRTVKERMKKESRFCAVTFPNQNVLAAAVILDQEGNESDCRFFRGGKQRTHQKNQVLYRLVRSRKSRGYCVQDQENHHLYEALRHINEHYSHEISKRIVSYCKEQNICVIVIPAYEETLNFTDKHYLSTDTYHWIGRSIIRNLRYKAFAEGIAVTSVRPYHVTDRCSVCGEEIYRYNEGHKPGKRYYGGKLFVCPNGHRGNAAENAAINLGRLFLSF